MTEELTWLPGWRIRDLIGDREVSPVEVTEHFLGRIEEIDPALHAFSHLDVTGARQQAKLAEEAVVAGDELGLLHGIPTAIKELIAVAGMPRTRLIGGQVWTAKWDAIAVERLRGAGAVIFGKNSMMGTGASGKHADRAGVFQSFNWDREARNPWDLSKIPGWSSSGGAAAAAAGLLPFAIGTDGGGSTRLPAAYSGVVGVHPTGGLFPERNVDYETPASPSGGTIGPLAWDVRDAALVTQALAGPDGRDPYCIQADPPNLLTDLDRGVAGLRFAWTDDYGYASVYASEDSRAVIDCVRNAAMGLRSLGAAVEVTDEVWEDVVLSQRTWDAFAPNNRLAGPNPEAEDLKLALESRARNWDRFRQLFRHYDLLLSVTAQRVARSIEEWDAAWTTEGPNYAGGSFAPTYTSHTAMFNVLRFPAVSVPCGFVGGLPVGLQIVGWPGRDALILRAANAFQQAFPRPERPTLG